MIRGRLRMSRLPVWKAVVSWDKFNKGEGNGGRLTLTQGQGKDSRCRTLKPPFDTAL
jgi:hypothetical protein